MVLAPVVLLLVLGIVQVGRAWYTVQVADAAVARGADAARLNGATDQNGEQAARAALHQLGPQLLTDATITVSRADGQVSVTLTGTQPGALPGLTWTVRRTATAPVEQVTP